MMEWIDLGYDVRLPLTAGSRWRVGDLDFRAFAALLGTHSERVRRIVSFDLNLSPRPAAALTNRPGAVQLAHGAHGSPAEALRTAGAAEPGARLLYWQIEKQSHAQAMAEGWFNFLPGDAVTPLPSGWRCIGVDVINDQGLSEYWDVAETFWALDPRLAATVNCDGLIEDEQLLATLLPSLPLDPANRWVMPVRAWSSC